MAGYLGKDDKFVKARFSQNWVFPYWWEFGRFYKKENGVYVPDKELVRLALIPFEERKVNNHHFDLFLDVRKYGWHGVIREANKRLRALQGRDEEKPKRKHKLPLKSDGVQTELKL